MTSKIGRPSAYSEELAVEICERMASGESLREICRDEHMPARSTVFLWIAHNKNGFSDRYAKAFEARMYYHADELLDIADDGSNDWMERNGDDGNPAYVTNGENIQRSRLRVDTRKWLMSKLLPQYKDKQEDTDKGDLSEVVSKLIDKLPS